MTDEVSEIWQKFASVLAMDFPKRILSGPLVYSFFTTFLVNYKVNFFFPVKKSTLKPIERLLT